MFYYCSLRNAILCHILGFVAIFGGRAPPVRLCVRLAYVWLSGWCLCGCLCGRCVLGVCWENTNGEVFVEHFLLCFCVGDGCSMGVISHSHVQVRAREKNGIDASRARVGRLGEIPPVWSRFIAFHSPFCWLKQGRQWKLDAALLHHAYNWSCRI